MSENIANQVLRLAASAEGQAAAWRMRLATLRAEVEGRCTAFSETLELLGSSPENASLRKKFEDKIRKERQSFDEMEATLAQIEARLSGYREALKLVEKESEDSEPELRAGSELHRIRDAIRLMGQPLTLTQMLETLGEKDNPGKRNSLRGSIGRYAREGKIFVQTAPNTFGLLELGHKPEATGPTPDEEVV